MPFQVSQCSWDCLESPLSPQSQTWMGLYPPMERDGLLTPDSSSRRVQGSLGSIRHTGKQGSLLQAAVPSCSSGRTGQCTDLVLLASDMLNQSLVRTVYRAVGFTAVRQREMLVAAVEQALHKCFQKKKAKWNEQRRMRAGRQDTLAVTLGNRASLVASSPLTIEPPPLPYNKTTNCQNTFSDYKLLESGRCSYP